MSSSHARHRTAGRVVDALSFDVEDWFHLVEIAGLDDPSTWPKRPSIVEAHTDWVLETLSSRGVRATFFVLGWIAERYPQLVRRIADAGHELGSHSHWHRPVYSLTRDEFREDLGRSIVAIENASGARVVGFRAPSFSITPGSEWAFDVLCELGIRYDASLFPGTRAHGGYDCNRAPHMFGPSPAGRMIPELPMSVMSMGVGNVAFSGGGYLRLLPLWLIRRGFAQAHAAKRPVVVYLHPRDLAVDCPRVPMPALRRFKSYTGLSTTRRKFLALLDEFDFASCGEVLAAANE